MFYAKVYMMVTMMMSIMPATTIIKYDILLYKVF